MSRVLIDTGPLVAYIQSNEKHSAWARETFDQLEAPFLTCEAVLTEACFLIGRGGGDPDDLLELIDRGLLQLPFNLHQELPRLRSLMKRYHNLPMSLADACLVRMSETIPKCQVVTLDRHFRVYRRHDRRSIPVLLPDA